MRIDCPICGLRDSREFTYPGSDRLLDRPGAGAGEAAFFDYVHIRENPAGPNGELWHHAMGCRAWLRVVRDTVSHEVISVALARDAKQGAR